MYFLHDAPYEGSGASKKYGDKINYAAIPAKYLKATTTEKEVRTDIYQAKMLRKEFAQPLNVVIIVKTNTKTGKWAHVALFSGDLFLSYDCLIDYYRLRFQIKFNFRDSKQHWGLEDLVNVEETAVTNAANISLFMVNASQLLLRDFRQQDSTVNALDLNAYYHSYKYVTKTLKWLPKKPEPLKMARIFERVSRLVRVHVPLPSPNPV